LIIVIFCYPSHPFQLSLVAQLIDAILGSNVNPILNIGCELIPNIGPTLKGRRLVLCSQYV